MYGKLFASMYNGSLATVGPWEALVTFQQLIVLADRYGEVDMTPETIARVTTIPLDIIQKGIDALEQPDPHSRTPDEDGRRILRLNPGRQWGWKIVNYQHYRSIRSAEERREYMRVYHQHYRKQRKQNKPDQPEVANSRSRGRSSKQEEEKKELHCEGKPSPQVAEELLSFLNQKTGRTYRAYVGENGSRKPTSSLDLILKCLKRGHTEQEIRGVIARKCRQWRGDPKMDQFLRPKTLFAKVNFDQYLGEQEASHDLPGLS